MIVEFGEKYLRDLYDKGECGDKRHRYRIDIIKRYKRGVDYLNGLLAKKTYIELIL